MLFFNEQEVLTAIVSASVIGLAGIFYTAVRNVNPRFIALERKVEEQERGTVHMLRKMEVFEQQSNEHYDNHKELSLEVEEREYRIRNDVSHQISEVKQDVHRLDEKMERAMTSVLNQVTMVSNQLAMIQNHLLGSIKRED
ncbi:hypothetical protein [Caudoviricetes sp.]|nr:hypothetical protein [Caudoviricetes sp.]